MAKLKAPSKAKASIKTPVRRNNARTWDVTWKVPSEWTSSNGKHKAQRVTHVEYRWFVNRVSTKGLKKDPYEKRGKHRASKTSDSFDLNFTYKKKSYTRQSFYPYTSTKIKDIVAQVRLSNEGGHGPWVSSDSADFKPPKKPTVAMTLGSNGVLSYTITSEYGNGKYERAYTEYWLEKYDSRTGKTTVVVPNGSGTAKSASLSITGTYSVADWQQLGYSDTMTFTLHAVNKGLAGDSEEVKKSVTLAFPAKATIDSITCHGKLNSDKVTVAINTNSSSKHPVTECSLWVLVNSDYAKASDIPGDADWEATGAVDNGSCKAFASIVGDLRPDKGKHTWLQVRTVNIHANPYTRRSDEKEVTALYQDMPSAADDRCGIISATPSADGTSADVLVGWTDVGGTNTGTELSWSSDPNAWKSTDPPSTFEFDWVDGNAPSGSGWTKASTIHLMGLTPGEMTYVRARRYLVNADDSSVVTYSPYCNPETVMAVSGPTSVIMDAPRYVPRGSGIEVTWGYNSDAEQKGWKVRRMVGAARSEDADTTLASGSDQRTSAVIQTDGITDASVTLYVQVDTGGTLISSEAESTVYLNDPPTATLSVDTLTVQPLSFQLTTGVPDATAKVEVVANGASDDEFHERQASGDNLWSALIEQPAWVASGNSYTATVTCPDGLDFRDGCDYIVRASVTDPRTGLSSSEAEAWLTVAWAHQAPKPPEDGITVVPSDVTDENGVRTRQCQIVLTAPDGAAQTDLYDVYRMTPDGQYLIFDGADLDAVVTDPYAPFGGSDMSYRVACRTVDGDVDFTDYAYELNTRGVTEPMEMRVDFGPDYVEFERGVAPSSKWSKSFAQHTGLDGSMPGMWGPGVTRTMSASPMLVRVYDNDRDKALRALAQYTGACFVRTSDGSAFCADVQVGHSTSVGSAGIVAQLSVTEMDLTAQYMATVSIAEDEEEQP